MTSKPARNRLSKNHRADGGTGSQPLYTPVTNPCHAFRRRGKRFIPVVLAIFAMMLLGGCTDTGSGSLESFVVDMLLGAASALLL